MKYQTKNKTKILTCLIENSDRHLTIEDIDTLLEHEVPLASIYRNIDELVKEGVILKFTIENNSSACYQFISKDSKHQHFHLKCNKCGKIFHLECEEVNDLLAHISKEHGFLVDVSKVTLYGVCPDCQKENN